MNWQYVYTMVILGSVIVGYVAGILCFPDRLVIVEQNNTLITEKVVKVELNNTQTIIVPMPCQCPVCPVVSSELEKKSATGKPLGAWENSTNSTAWYHSMECTQYVGCKY